MNEPEQGPVFQFVGALRDLTLRTEGGSPTPLAESSLEACAASPRDVDPCSAAAIECADVAGPSVDPCSSAGLY
jgi:hypothetical protein